MRTYPTKLEKEKVKLLNAEKWQLDLLKLNPEYVFWGCFEDYMSKKEGGWDSRIITPTWSEHNWELNELNECVNFYFEVYRKNHECEYCEGSGYNKATKKLSEEWYSFGVERWINVSSNRRYNDNAWQYHLTEIEIEALVKDGRLSDLFDKWYRYDKKKNTWSYLQREENKPRNEWQWIECEKPEMPTPEKVNEWAKHSIGHDAINRFICVEARAKHLGIYGHCEHCNGKGVLYDEPTAKVALQLWYLHPRKGCSRGAYIEEIKQEDLPNIIKYLKEAAKRNADRFSKLNQIKL